LNALFSVSDDYAWSKVRATITKRFPEFSDLFSLNIEIESGFRSALLPVIRSHDYNSPALLEAVSSTSTTLFGKFVFPTAIYGSNEAMVAWGSEIVHVMRAMAAISPEVCGTFALDGVNRSSPNSRIDASLRASQRAVIEAYRTSNKARHPLPDERTVKELYAKAVALAQPPFSQKELQAFEAIEKQPKAQVCSLLTRFFEAIERLDTSSKATAYRMIMKERL
jgi:hypothetical protein